MVPLRARSALPLFAAAALLACLPGRALPRPRPADAAREESADEEDLNVLSMEVAALQMMHQLDLTPFQLEAFTKLAKEAAPKDEPRNPASASDKYRRTLLQYREALIKGEGERADDLGAELEDLRQSEEPNLDDQVDVTDEARRLAPKALKLLGARQVTAYLGLYGDDLPDPLDDLLSALDQSHDLGDKEWQQLRDDTASDIGWLVAGFDEGRAHKVADKAGALLDRARGLKDDEFPARRPDLEKEARVITGEVGPTEVLRHVLERDLAELLSNPQLPAALRARKKAAKE